MVPKLRDCVCLACSAAVIRQDGLMSTEFDYIIVGAGTAGCLLANRLSADPTQRVLLVDDVLKVREQPGPSGISLTERTCWRYQYGNHLGSVGLELDEAAQVISYEEFHPYGTSAYRLRNDDAVVRAPAKRYRYTGMERDEESGLSYHRTRFLSPPLGRWTSPDSRFVGDGVNLYRYVHASPASNSDRSGEACDPQMQSCVTAPPQENQTQNSSTFSNPQITVKRDVYFKYVQNPTQWKAYLESNGQLEGRVETPKAKLRNVTQKAVDHASPETLKKMGSDRISVTYEPETAEAFMKKQAQPDPQRLLSTSKRAVEKYGGTFIDHEELMGQLENARDERAASNLSTRGIDYAAKQYKRLSEAQVVSPTPAGAFRQATTLDYLQVSAARTGTAGFIFAGAALDISAASETRSPSLGILHAGTASAQLTGGVTYVAGWAAGDVGVMGIGTAIAAPAAALSFMVGSLALAYNEIAASLAGEETAIHKSVKSFDRLRLAGERQGGVLGSLKQGLGVVGIGGSVALDLLQGNQDRSIYLNYKW